MSVAQREDAGRFPRLTEEQMAWVGRLGETLDLEDEQEILTEGESGYDFFVVVSGRIQISKRAAGGTTILRVHEEREFVGELTILTGGPSPCTARSVGESRVSRLSPSALRDVLSSCPEMAETVIPAMAKRVHDIEGILQERERLAALGKLAAGLAHELNNPVAAGSRAVAGVRGLLSALREHSLSLGETCFAPGEVAAIREHLERAAARIGEDDDRSPLERSDQEEAVGEWLEGRGCEDAWDIAPTLVSAGFDPPGLDALVGRFDDRSATRVLDFIATQLSVEAMLRDAERSLTRISEIVRAVKGYSRMDQAPVAETDVNAGLDDTLKMLAYPLRPFQIKRDYQSDLPTVCAYASELNQVWTNLIDNAAAAMGSAGTLTIRTRHTGEDEVTVEIADTGPGIPPEVQPRIFEAFFTTKPVGEGTGLGLDIAQRIVTVRHNGRIDFETSPDGTTFRVRLPIRQASE